MRYFIVYDLSNPTEVVGFHRDPKESEGAFEVFRDDKGKSPLRAGLNPGNYRIEWDGETPLLKVKTVEELKQIKADQDRAPCLEQLERDMHEMSDKDYDARTQMSLFMMFVDPDTPLELKADLSKARDWGDTVLDYYYEKKAEIETAPDPASITWDFWQFEKTLPTMSTQDETGTVTLRKARKKAKQLKST